MCDPCDPDSRKASKLSHFGNDSLPVKLVPEKVVIIKVKRRCCCQEWWLGGGPSRTRCVGSGTAVLKGNIVQ